MKIAFVWVFFFAISASAQVRLISTNILVDLTAAMTAGPSRAYSKFWLVGKVAKIEGKVAYVAVDTGEIRYVYSPPANKTYGDASDTLSMAAAATLSSSNGISAGQFLSMSPRMKENFAPQKVYENVLVMNPPQSIALNAPFKSCGVDRGIFRVAGRGIGRSFDCGQPFTGEVTTNYQCFIPSPTGLVRVKKF